MTEVSRNAPCPCGSGRKYKVCCLRREYEWQLQRSGQVSAMRVAVDWLLTHHRAAVGAALDKGFFGVMGEDEWATLERLGEVGQTVEINSSEWLLAEAVLGLRKPDGKRARIRASRLVLGEGGPLLPAEQREYLEAVAAGALRLYEVAAVEPGSCIHVRDALLAESPAARVRDVSLSRSLQRWDVIALRLVAVRDSRVPSGCVYHYPPPLSSQVLEEVREFLRRHDAPPDTHTARRIEGESVSQILRDRWLLAITRPRRMPRLVDARSGDPIVLAEDHFLVADWGLLEGLLATQPDVGGSRAEGWSLLEDGGNRWPRSRWSMRVGRRGDTLMGFARTLRAADAGRAWLEALAGPLVRFQAREIVDPASPAAAEIARRKRPSADPLGKLSPEERTNAFQQIHEQIYRNWADEPIPMLDNLTPRQAIQTAEGRERVARLLKDYEVSEARRARDEGREPTDFGFLWASVGLKRGVAAGVATSSESE